MMDQAGPARRLTTKGEATRARIVEAAAELIAAHGVAGTSTDDVRRAAGVSGSQLYHYFDGKRALISAVITRQADRDTGVGDLGLGALDSMEALRAWADAAIERQESHAAGGDCSLSTLAGELSGSDETSRAQLSAGFLRWKNTLLHGLTAMQQRGELRPDADLDALSYALLAALQGGQLLTQTMRSTEALRAAMTAVLAYVAGFTTAAA